MGDILTFLKPLITISFVVVIYFVLFSVRAFYNRLRTHGYGRDLSDTEYSKIEDLALIIWNDAISTKYPKYFRFFNGGVLFFAMGAVVAVGLYWVIYKSLRHKILERIPDTAAYVFARTDFSFSGVLALFVGLMLATLFCLFLARQRTLVKKFLIYQQGWGQLIPGERDPGDICEDLLHLYYVGEINLDEKQIDIDDILSKILNRPKKVIYFFSAFFFILFAVFFRFDLYWYEWQDQNKFVKNGYFSTNETSFAMSDIQQIDRICRITKNKKIPKSHFEYWIVGPDGTKFDLGHEPWKRVFPIANHAFTNPNLYANPVKVIKAPAVPDRKKSIETCVKYLAHEYDGVTATLLTQIYETRIPGNQLGAGMAATIPQKSLRGPNP